jgi:hypothetical protein
MKIDLVPDKLYFVEFLKQLVVGVELIVVEMVPMMIVLLMDLLEMMMDVVVHVMFVAFHH